MAIYAIGDIQGCLTPLKVLLDTIEFDPEKDQVWFVGDLVNRGPHSLETLRFVKALGESAITVLGNHDIHCLRAVLVPSADMRSDDNFEDLLEAPDAPELLQWLRHLPIAHYDPTLNVLLTHAGVNPMWTLNDALVLAKEVENTLRSEAAIDFLDRMYKSVPKLWDPKLKGQKRLRHILSSFTRMRYVTTHGELNFKVKQAPGKQSKELMPWFEYPERPCDNVSLVFGHWALLGIVNKPNIMALDSGCVYGRALTAVQLDHPDRPMTSVPCTRADFVE